jgi:hypothetical protein
MGLGAAHHSPPPELHGWRTPEVDLVKIAGQQTCGGLGRGALCRLSVLRRGALVDCRRERSCEKRTAADTVGTGRQATKAWPQTSEHGRKAEQDDEAALIQRPAVHPGLRKHQEHGSQCVEAVCAWRWKCESAGGSFQGSWDRRGPKPTAAQNRPI